MASAQQRPPMHDTPITVAVIPIVPVSKNAAEMAMVPMNVECLLKTLVLTMVWSIRSDTPLEITLAQRVSAKILILGMDGSVLRSHVLDFPVQEL